MSAWLDGWSDAQKDEGAREETRKTKRELWSAVVSLYAREEAAVFFGRARRHDQPEGEGDAPAGVGGTVDLPTGERDAFLEELEALIRRYGAS